MKRKFVSGLGIVVLAGTLVTTAFASNSDSKTLVTDKPVSYENNRGIFNTYSMMMDEDRLNQFVSSGQISSKEKEYYLDMYEDCSRYETRYNRGNGTGGRGCH